MLIYIIMIIIMHVNVVSTWLKLLLENGCCKQIVKYLLDNLIKCILLC